MRLPFRPEKHKSGTRVTRLWGSSPEHAWVSEGRGEAGVCCNFFILSPTGLEKYELVRPSTGENQLRRRDFRSTTRL